jgi:hypothetical protein
VSSGIVSITGDAECRRLADVLAVPTVLEHDEVAMLTGTSIVFIDYAAAEDIDQTLALAGTLRPVGQSGALTRLPPPTSKTRAYVDRHRGPAAP